MSSGLIDACPDDDMPLELQYLQIKEENYSLRKDNADAEYMLGFIATASTPSSEGAIGQEGGTLEHNRNLQQREKAKKISEEVAAKSAFLSSLRLRLARRREQLLTSGVQITLPTKFPASAEWVKAQLGLSKTVPSSSATPILRHLSPENTPPLDTNEPSPTTMKGVEGGLNPYQPGKESTEMVFLRAELRRLREMNASLQQETVRRTQQLRFRKGERELQQRTLAQEGDTIADEITALRQQVQNLREANQPPVASSTLASLRASVL